jgi:hypothetical protein
MKKLIFCATLLLAACSNKADNDLATGKDRVAILSFVGRQVNALENTLPDLGAVNAQIDRLNARKPLWSERPGLDDIYAGSQMLRWKYDATSWGIDKFVVDKVTALVAPRIKPIPFEYDPADYHLDGTWDAYPYLDGDKIADSVRRQPGYTSQKADTYIVIVPGRWHLGIFERPSDGIGILKDFQAYYPPEYSDEIYYVLHAFYNVAILDRELNLIALERPRDVKSYGWRFKGNPGEFVDVGLWADSFEELTLDQQAQIAEMAKSLIAESLPATLRGVGLIP